MYAEKFSQKHTDLCVRFFLCVHIGWDYRMGILSGKKFFPKGWLNCNPAKRYLYIDDLEEKYNVAGMRRCEIEELLGSPTWRKTEPGTEKIIYYEYRIQDNLLAGWKVYQVRFQDDIVIDTTIIVEDW